MCELTAEQVTYAYTDHAKTERLNQVLKSNGLINRYITAAYYTPPSGHRILIKCRLLGWVEIRKWSGTTIVVNGWLVYIDQLENPTERFSEYHQRELRWWAKWRSAIFEAARLLES